MKPPLDKKFKEINDITLEWRQGDCYVGEHYFHFRANPNHHVATNSKLKKEDIDIQTVEVGFCVVTQTCDIVRCCSDRPYMEVAPLVIVEDENLLDSIARGERPNYGFLPELKNQKYVVDLDRTMTVEKSCLKGINRTVGCTTVDDRQRFAQNLARKRARFAFPNEFNAVVKKFRKKMIDKHKDTSDEGRALIELKEIRVAADPSWYAADDIVLFFHFIRASGTSKFTAEQWQTFKDGWLKLLNVEKPFKSASGEVTTLEILSAAEYLGSAQLDLDHLSNS